MAKESWLNQPQRIFEQFVYRTRTELVNGQTITYRDTEVRPFAGSTITYAFPTTAAAVRQLGDTQVIPITDPVQRAALAAAVKLWDDLIAPEFKEATGPLTSYRSSDLEFYFYQSADSRNETAAHIVEFVSTATPTTYAERATGSVRFSFDYSNGVFRQIDVNRTSSGNGYAFQTLVHEIGHALGLNHTGLYNGKIDNPNAEILFYEDSLLFSTMSYIGPWRADLASFVDIDADWIASDNISHYPQTPMLLDVYAIQRIYGASTTTRLGNTTYGFNTSFTGSDRSIFDFTVNRHPVLTIFDSGGDGDTLDLSGFATPSRINLAPGSASDADAMTRNIWIALDTWIENAVGGPNNDSLSGNSRANVLRGGAGNDMLLGLEGDDTLDGGPGSDRLEGGPGTDTALFSGAWGAYDIAVSLSTSTATLTFTLDRSVDTAIGIEWFQFADRRLSLSQLKSGDTTAPALAATVPAGGAGNIAPGADLVFVFSEPVSAGGGSIRLLDAAGSLLRSIGVNDRQVSIAGNVLTLNLNDDLNPSTSYQVLLDPGLVQDVSGNPFAGLAQPQALRFTTASPADRTPPLLLGTLPSNDSVGVPVTADLTLAFSEPVQRGSGSITILLAGGTVFTTISAGDTSQVTVDGSRVTINPTAVLAPGTAYYVNVGSGAFRDAAGNAFAGITGSSAFKFTTARAPDDYPADATTSGRVTLGAAAATGRIETAGDVDHFRVDLVAGTSYRFLLAAAASSGLGDPRLSLLDANGRALATDDDSGGGRNALIAFTATTGGVYYLTASDAGTGTGNYSLSATIADLTPPVLLSSTPSAGASGVAPASSLVLTFSEPVVAGTGRVSIVRAGGAVERSFAIGDSTQVRIDGRTVTIDPSTDLQAGVDYLLRIDAGALRDAAGNPWSGFVGGGALSFRTQPVADDVPGNTSTTAVLVPDGGTRSGVIETQRDIDMFRVTLQSGRTYVFDLLPASAGGLTDPYLTLWIDGEDRPVEQDDDSGDITGAARITFTAVRSGLYFLQINDAALGTGAYVVGVRTVTDDFPWSTATTGVVPVGGRTTGAIEIRGDLDLFKVSLNAGVSYTFTLDGSGAQALPNPYLQLYSSNVTLLAFDDDSGDGANARLTFTPASSGTFYLGVADAASGTGTYTISAQLAGDTSPPRLQVAVPADNAINVARYARLVLTFDEPVQAGNAPITLWQADGTVYATLTAPDPRLRFDGRTLTIDFGVEMAATRGYYLTIAPGAVRDLAGNAWVGLSGSNAYNFNTAADDFSQSTATTGNVTIGGTSRGRIEVALDVDLFAVALLADTEYVFDLDPFGADGLTDPLLRLFRLVDRSLVELARDDDGGSSTGTDARITFTPSASGTYYLAASDFAGGTGSYLLAAAVRDIVAPSLVSAAPVQGATGVAVDADFVFRFSEDVRAGSGDFTIRTSSGVIVGTPIAVGDATQVRITGSVLTLNPSFDLAPGISYSITLPAGAVVDLAGNAFAGLGGSRSYGFTVAGTADDFPFDRSTSGVVPTDGSPRGGTIEMRGDADLLKTSLLAGYTYVFTLDASASSSLKLPSLQLFDPDLKRLAVDEADAGSNGQLTARIVYQAVLGGSYYLGASDSGGGTGAYRIAATAILDDHAGDRATRSVLAVGGTAASGRIQFDGDADWFSVALAAGTAYTFELRPGSIQGLTSPLLALHGPGGDRVASASSGSKSGAPQTLTFAPTSSGTYYLAASSSSATATGAYELVARIAPDDYPWSTATTGVVTVGGAASSGTISFDGDLDLFKVTLVAGRSYRFDLVGSGSPALADPFLYLYSPDLKLLDTDDNGGSKGGASRIQYTPTSGGTYYLGAGNVVNGTGSYTLSANTYVDTSAPRLTGASPADNAVNVARTSKIVLSFDEPVLAGAGTIEIRRSDGSLLTSFPVADTSRITFDDRRATIDTGFELSPLRGYYVTMPAGAIRDSAGNPFAGFAGSSAYNFTVADDDFSSTARTTGVVPVGGSIGGRIEAVSDEDMFQVTVAAGQAYVFELSPATNEGLSDPLLELYRYVDGRFELLAVDDDSGTPKPAGSKSGGAGAKLEWTAPSSGSYWLLAADSAAGTGAYVLRARVADSIAPTLRSTSPADDAVAVSRTANLVLTFDEPVVAGSGSVTLQRADGSVLQAIPIGDTSQVRINGSVVTIDPASDLPAGIVVHVLISPGALRDIAGNPFAGIVDRGRFDFTIAGLNFNPVSASGSTTINEDGRASGRLPAATDPDGDPVSYRLSAGAGDGVASIDPDGRFSYVPNANFSGSDRFSFQVLDGRGGIASYRFDVVVIDVPDRFVGTDGNDTMHGYPGRDSYFGLAGNDVITTGPGDDSVDGGSGRDTLVVSGPRASYSITVSGASRIVQHPTLGSDTIVGVERIRFDDQSLALDLNGNAGIAARIVGALFGPSRLSDLALVGRRIQQLDGGASFEQAVASALAEPLFMALAGSRSNDDFVQLVYRNVVGVAPDGPTAAYYVGLLTSGAYDQVSLGRLASEIDLTAQRVDLVGLADTGLPYQGP